jgi:hypothetical protein
VASTASAAGAASTASTASPDTPNRSDSIYKQAGAASAVVATSASGSGYVGEITVAVESA